VLETLDEQRHERLFSTDESYVNKLLLNNVEGYVSNQKSKYLQQVHFCTALLYSKLEKHFKNIVVDVSSKDDKTKASEFPEIDRKRRRS
jgi:hypothetical protein